ncbi:DUF418 domain-containing protein [Oceanobacillus sp. FSL H7-0719]|uniref:DUF418 domain-containing protein n=1 Tax=Oceanobacillus sp. FSL H7-0719 TaxID=2954507 RepID=UPI0032490B99
MDNKLMPVKEQNRIVWIDIVRGFAILGIFIVNIGAFSAPYFLYGGAENAWSEPVEQFIQMLIDVFFQGSFYTLFSILYGFSWQLMKDRLDIKGINYAAFLFRRQLILVGIGMVHAFLIWHGDILLSYGLIGLLLLFFIEVKDRTLLLWAVLLLGGSVSFFTISLYQVRYLLGGANETAISQAIESYSSTQLSVILGQNLQDWSNANSGIAFILLIITLLPLFLLGMYIARKQWLHEPQKHQQTLWRLLKISFFLFILLKLGPYSIGNPLWLSYLQDNLGGAASALFYIVLITLISQSALGLKIVMPFKYVGRMALSNYILQSVFCFILFYGIGFGLYGSIKPSIAILIVIVFYSLQIIGSKWWLSRFRFGPLEWIWRTLSYKKKQVIRK